MKHLNFEFIFYLAAIITLGSLGIWSVNQMDGRNDCFMSKFYGFSKDKQEYFCKGIK